VVQLRARSATTGSWWWKGIIRSWRCAAAELSGSAVWRCWCAREIDMMVYDNWWTRRRSHGPDKCRRGSCSKERRGLLWFVCQVCQLILIPPTPPGFIIFVCISRLANCNPHSTSLGKRERERERSPQLTSRNRRQYRGVNQEETRRGINVVTWPTAGTDQRLRSKRSCCMEFSAQFVCECSSRH
jgi:hypothetical protein